FKRLLNEAPRASAQLSPIPPPERGRSDGEAVRVGVSEENDPTPALRADPRLSGEGFREEQGERGSAAGDRASPLAIFAPENTETEEPADSPWPDLVVIDGGQGQLTAARETFAELGVTGVPLVAVAKGPARDAGRETFFMPGRESFKLPQRDPVLYFVQRLRDEAHRFAIGSHRQKRKKDIREAGLQEIPGIGPMRKRALLRHFGTLKAIERASVADLEHAPGI